MILNKPYLQISELEGNAYRLSILVKIPDGFDIGPFEVKKVKEGKEIKITATRMLVPDQIHHSFKETVVWLYDVPKDAKIEVRITKPKFLEIEKNSSKRLDLRKSEKKKQDFLGRTVVLASEADRGRPGSSKDGDQNGNNNE